MGLCRHNGPPTNLDGGVAKEMIRCDTETSNYYYRDSPA
jgi:hypothetical protein